MSTLSTGSLNTPRGALRFTLLCALALIAMPQPAAAQQQELAAIDSLIAGDDFATARARLATWWKTHAPLAEREPALRAHALFLRARLETDPRNARDDYLAIALGTPAAPQAPAALLYLAQGLLATAEHQRAANYLERLIRDYPTSPLRETARLWLVRVLKDAGRPNAACTTARQQGDAARDPDLAALLQAEAAEACASAAKGGADRPFPTATDEQKTTSAPSAPGATARFALQLGAFREEAGANALVARLRKAGFQPRIIYIPGSKLRRVRVGTFQSATQAEPIANKLRAAGFDIVMVNDAAQERTDP